MSSVNVGPINGVSDARAASYQVRLPFFQGPLELLLHLIEKEELDITTVSLAQVTDQYLEYIAVLRELDAEFLTDFLVIAARLILIKSRALLPAPPPSIEDDEEEDDGEALARQLREYKRFKEAAGWLRDREAEGTRSYRREAPPPRVEPRLVPGDVSVEQLFAALLKALEDMPERAHGVNHVVSPITVTIGQQMEMLKDTLSAHKRVSLSTLFDTMRSRTEVIVTFLAALELVKQYVIRVTQEVPFGEITLELRSDEVGANRVIA